MSGPDVPDVAKGSDVGFEAVKVRRSTGWILPLIKMTCSLLADLLKKTFNVLTREAPQFAHNSRAVKKGGN